MEKKELKKFIETHCAFISNQDLKDDYDYIKYYVLTENYELVINDFRVHESDVEYTLVYKEYALGGTYDTDDFEYAYQNEYRVLMRDLKVIKMIQLFKENELLQVVGE